jgi:hypothetical protein
MELALPLLAIADESVRRRLVAPIADLLECEFTPTVCQFEFLIGYVAAVQSDEFLDAAQLANRYAAHFHAVEFTATIREYFEQVWRWFMEGNPESRICLIACETLSSLWASAGIEFGAFPFEVTARMAFLTASDDPDLLRAIANLAVVIIDCHGRELDAHSEEMRAIAGRFTVLIQEEYENPNLVGDSVGIFRAFAEKMPAIWAEFGALWIHAAAAQFSTANIGLSGQIANVFLEFVPLMDDEALVAFHGKAELMRRSSPMNIALSQVAEFEKAALAVLRERGFTPPPAPED